MEPKSRDDFTRLIDRFLEVAANHSDLDFLDSGGRLDLHRRIADVQCIRIEIPALVALCLRSVIIDAEGLSDPIAGSTRTASSAADREAAQRLREGVLLDPEGLGQDGCGVHTKHEPRPWLEIAFDHPVDLRRLQLHNVIGEHSVAARGIQVLARTTDGTWTSLYDGLQRERRFVAELEQRERRRSALRRIGSRVRRRPGMSEPDPIRSDLIRVLTAIQLRDYRHISKDVFRLDLTAEEVSEFRRLVSERLIAKRELEWTIHGIKRSFRFWTEQQKQEYLGFAVDVIDCLKQLNDKVCFGFGSVLSIVRDHELMPHDDDLDVLVGFEKDQAPTLAVGLELIKECLQDGGFRVEGDEYLAYRWVFPPGGSQKIDAFAGIFEGDAISWYPGKRGVLTRSMMFPPREESFLGRRCPIPREAERYLEQIYGPGWVTPDPHFKHRWRRSEYADIAQ